MAVSRKLRRYRAWIAAGALVLIAAAALYLYRQAGTEEPTTTYTTEAATTGILSVTVSGTGNVAVDGTTEVWSDTAGTVASVAVSEGDSVATGTVLFTLDSESAEADTARALVSYRQAQSSVTQAQATLVRAENALAELQDRYDEQTAQAASSATATGGVSGTAASPTTGDTTTQTSTQTEEVTQADIDAAEADVASAEANVDSANASLSSAAIDYDEAQAAEDDLAVTSPCSGVVHALDVAEGDSVSAEGSSASSSSSASTGGATGATGTTVTGASASTGAPITLAPAQPLAVCLTVNEVDLPTLEIGQRADIEFDALPDATATGKVYEIAEEGSNSSGVVTFEVWVSIDVADSGLRPGMSAAATIVTDIAQGALLVPNGAVKSASDGTYYVEVMQDGATEPTQVAVETGLANATETQILSGLSEGDLVVTTTTTDDGSSEGAESDEGERTFGPGAGGGMPGAGPMGGF